MATKVQSKSLDDPAAIWVSRIVGHKRLSPDKLIPHPFNVRRHTAKQERLMLGLLESGGVMAPLIVSKRTMHILDGHLRHTLATRHGIGLLDVVLVDVTDEEELLILATFDAVGFLADLEKDAQWVAARAAMSMFGQEELSGWLSGFAPGDAIDHTAVVAAGDDFGDGSFGGVLRQFVFQMTIEEYEAAVPGLVAVMDREGLDDTVAAVYWLLDKYGEVPADG